MTTPDRDTYGRFEHHDDHDRPDRKRDKALAALDSSREKVGEAARRTVETLEGNPLGILVGGLAVGVLAGALIPRSARERDLLAPIGKQLGDRARAAADAAREAGKTELAGLGLSKDAARSQARNLFEGVTKAMATAGTAARDAAVKSSAE